MLLLVKLYNNIKQLAPVLGAVFILFTITSCNHTTFSTLTNSKRNELLADANRQRARQGISPLALSEQLSTSAEHLAQKVASAVPPQTGPSDPLGRLIREGVFARFALSCTVTADSAENAFRELFANPLHAGKLQHTGISHIGFGLASNGGRVVLVVDMARLVDTVNTEEIARKLMDQIHHNRARIEAVAIAQDTRLMDAAARMNREFSASGKSSEALIESVKSDLAGSQMTLGKITISFQTASLPEDIVLAERTSDPTARYIGIAVNQANVQGQDAGAIIVTLILGSPQQTDTPDNNAARRPKPRAMPDGHRPSKKATLEEQAWLATLVGNHKKAAQLFMKAYRQTNNSKLLYEAARAHARNREIAAALDKMNQYAALCETECNEEEKATAEEMVEKLKRGESIFATSKEAQYSLEAKRFFILGQKLFADGEWEGAIDAFSQAYAYAPHPDLIYNMGLAHLKAGNIGDALDFFQEYQRQVPEAKSTEQAQQLFEIGVELYNVGQFDAAAKRFTMAYGFLPLDEILYNLALCHQAMGDKTEALRLFQELADKTDDKAQKAEYLKRIEELNP